MGKYKKIFGFLRIFLILYLFSPIFCFPLPQVDNVENGDVNIDSSLPNTLIITATSNSIINYSSFNIAEDETVKIILPDTTSKILNRVIGNTSSDISGSLFSNGIIFLINPNGINFSSSSNVNASGIVASTNNILSSNFLASNYVFEKEINTASSITNKGNIKIEDNGYLVFISDSIKNEGTITANLGTIILASGKKTILTIDQNNLLSIIIDEPTQQKLIDSTSAIENTGIIKANSGKIILDAKTQDELFDKVINTSGLIEAKKVLLDSATGEVILLGDGDIEITGEINSDKITIGEQDNLSNNVSIKANLYATEDITILAKNNIQITKDIISEKGDISIFADYDNDNIGDLSLLGASLKTNLYGNILLDSSGTMTLDGIISTEYGSIKIGTKRSPLSIEGNPAYIHTQGDFIITNKYGEDNNQVIETERGDVLRYNKSGSLKLEASSGKITDTTQSPIIVDSLSIIANQIYLDTASYILEIFQTGQDIYITEAIQNPNNTMTLNGNNLRITYLKSTNLTLKSQNSIDTEQGIIISADTIKLISNRFGTQTSPINLDANFIHIQRQNGDIDILESLGIGNSICLRGPPEFGAIVYNNLSNLTLQTDNGSIYIRSGVILNAKTLNLTAWQIDLLGTLKANSVYLFSPINGNIILEKDSLIDVSSDTLESSGGYVEILGTYISLYGAIINASSPAGGGTVLIGGDFQGKGTQINALIVYINRDSYIYADATDLGNGGKVIVWSDISTIYYGHISAKGGPNGGDGGFVQISSLQSLKFNGFVDATAFSGNRGTFILEPFGFGGYAPTIATDKLDYMPGEVVNIIGSGWQANEEVLLTLHPNKDTLEDITLTAIADGNGNFSNSELLLDNSHFGVLFLVTALGKNSQSTAQTTFSDATITFRAAGAKASGTGSVTVGLPSGLVANDIVILVATTIAGGSITITASGSLTWTALSGTPINVTGGEKLYVWWARYSSGSTGPTLQPGSDHICAGTIAYYNVHNVGSPINVYQTGTETTSDRSFSFATSISTSIDGEMVIVICSTGADTNNAQFSSWTNSNLSSIAERLDYCTNSGGGGGFGLAEGMKTTAGSIGTWAATLSTATTKAYITFSLIPLGGASSITVSGTVYAQDRSTPLGGQTVRVAVNGVDFSTTAVSDASTGTFSISGITSTSGDVITIYLEDMSADAVTVTVRDWRSSLSNISLYQNHLVIRHDNSGALTNSNLSTAAVSGEDDISNIYTVSSGTLTVASGKTLFIPSGHSFTPGGNINVGGDFINNGKFDPNGYSISTTNFTSMDGEIYTSGAVNITASGYIGGFGKPVYISSASSININASSGSVHIKTAAMSITGYTDNGNGTSTLTLSNGSITYKNTSNLSLTTNSGDITYSDAQNDYIKAKNIKLISAAAVGSAASYLLVNAYSLYVQAQGAVYIKATPIPPATVVDFCKVSTPANIYIETTSGSIRIGTIISSSGSVSIISAGYILQGSSTQAKIQAALNSVLKALGGTVGTYNQALRVYMPGSITLTIYASMSDNNRSANLYDPDNTLSWDELLYDTGSAYYIYYNDQQKP